MGKKEAVAKKSEAAAQKKAAEDKKAADAEAKKWEKGAKDNSKAAAAADKQAEAARKKAEKEALMKEEEASLPTKAPKGSKAAPKKSRGLDLSALDDPSPASKKAPALNATGIDNALDALSLTTDGNADKLDRHPERRKKAAYAAFQERRLAEMEDEKGLRRQQKIELIRKEFEKSPENPMNQLHAEHDTSREEMKEMKASARSQKEDLLAGK